MVAAAQIVPGMILSIGDKFYRVESAVKVAVPKGAPFLKTKLKDLVSGKSQEKSFKLDQSVTEVALVERELEFLYPEGDEYMFLDVVDLEKTLIPQSIVGTKINYLKEGVQVAASFYGDRIFGLELPPYLELMVASVSGDDADGVPASNATRNATLESGAKVEVPPFIEPGDIVKIDTKTGDYIQRV